MALLLGPIEQRIIKRLRELIDPEHRMRKSEVVRYCVRWVGTRLDNDILWIEPPKRRPVRGSWQPHELAMLGRMSDIHVALRTGRSYYNVMRRRVEMEIPRFVPPVDLDAKPPTS
jgi:hypothetical protein